MSIWSSRPDPELLGLVQESLREMGASDMEKAKPKQAQSLPVPSEGSKDEPKSLFYDPFAIIEQLGFKDRPSQISYGTLEAMVYRTPIIRTIINTRIDQIAGFSRPSHDRYGMGFRIKLRDSDKEPTRVEQKWSKDMENLFTHTGVTNNFRGRASMSDFLKKTAFDSLVYDQYCWEIVPNNKGLPAEWYVVDGATIRLADSGTTYVDADKLDQVRYVQIYDGVVIAEYTQEELCFGVRNPRSSIRLAGYGESELEMLVPAVTSILWAWEYNQKFFCMCGDSLVNTRNGLIPIENLVGNEFEVWDGYRWERAAAFETGIRSVSRTRLTNGLTLDTSPEHRFRVVTDDTDGEPGWIQQKDLKPGDYVLVDSTPIAPEYDPNQFHVNKKYDTDRGTGRSFIPTDSLVKDLEFWEMIGFALGDGYWPNLAERVPHSLRIFPHYSKDTDLFDKFLGVCSRHSIHAYKKDVNSKVQRSDGDFGYPAIYISHKAFLEWLYELGFMPSSKGKRIPVSVYQMPKYVREALLRGLFSADGCTKKHVTGYKTPSVYSASTDLTQDILRCLLSVGIMSYITGQKQYGEVIPKDVNLFASRIGYLQPYKNEGLCRSDRVKYKWDKLHPSTSILISDLIYSTARLRNIRLSEKDSSLVRKARLGITRVSRKRAIKIMRDLDLEIPEVLRYHHVPIECTEDMGSSELMFDVEVFNNRHLFVANFMATHNSQGSTNKGLINFKGVNTRNLQDFRRHWYQLTSGVENAWRTPVTSADDVQWVDMQQSNRDMEFNAWMDFLIKVACAMYKMDPVEVNFKYGNTGQGNAMSESSNREKVTLSKERGLRPILRNLEESFNRHILWPINEDFEFEFVGLDAETKQEFADLVAKKVKTVMTVDELRAQEDLQPLPDGKGEVILDPNWMQFSQAKDAPEGEMGDMGTDADGNAEADKVSGAMFGSKKEKKPDNGKDAGDTQDTTKAKTNKAQYSERIAYTDANGKRRYRYVYGNKDKVQKSLTKSWTVEI